jgi:enamine deaminase RidA (YjgF/YER057c/UK114 family)
LAAGGSSTKNVLKTTVLLVDMADYASVNEVYSKRCAAFA